MAFLIAILAGAVFVVPLLVLGYDIQTTVVLVGSTAASQLGMFALAVWYRTRRRVSIPLSRPSRAQLGYVVGGVLGALIAAIGLSLVLDALGLLPNSVISDVVTANPTYLLGLAVLSAFLIAPVEEFVFRGVIQGRLRQQFGPLPAILGASVLFGSMHLANYTGQFRAVLAGALLIASVGAIFGAIYERTQNLLVPILVHGGYNVVLLVSSYLAQGA
jgi:hypothetical protein